MSNLIIIIQSPGWHILVQPLVFATELKYHRSSDLDQKRLHWGAFAYNGRLYKKSKTSLQTPTPSQSNVATAFWNGSRSIRLAVGARDQRVSLPRKKLNILARVIPRKKYNNQIVWPREKFDKLFGARFFFQKCGSVCVPLLFCFVFQCVVFTDRIKMWQLKVSSCFHILIKISNY